MMLWISPAKTYLIVIFGVWNICNAEIVHSILYTVHDLYTVHEWILY